MISCSIIKLNTSALCKCCFAITGVYCILSPCRLSLLHIVIRKTAQLEEKMPFALLTQSNTNIPTLLISLMLTTTVSPSFETQQLSGGFGGITETPKATEA